MVSPFGDLGPAGPQPKSRPFRVAGLFYSGMYEYDAKFAYLELAEAQRFFGTGDSVTGLELKVTDVNAARPVMRQVLAALDGYPFRTKDWGELNRNLFSALMMEKMVMAVILGFIVLVASFIIVATLIMLVLEKTREIAVLKSMGATTTSIMKIFVVEGLIIGAVGTVFGLVLGLGTYLLVAQVGIPLDPEVYYINNLPVLIDGGDFALVALPPWRSPTWPPSTRPPRPPGSSRSTACGASDGAALARRRGARQDLPHRREAGSRCCATSPWRSPPASWWR